MALFFFVMSLDNMGSHDKLAHGSWVLDGPRCYVATALSILCANAPAPACRNFEVPKIPHTAECAAGMRM